MVDSWPQAEILVFADRWGRDVAESKRQILECEILKMSVANVWDRARREWVLLYAWLEDEWGECLCTHPSRSTA